MKHTDYFCDHCGKKLCEDDFPDIKIDCCDTKEQIDLCEDCYGEFDDLFNELLNNFIKENEEDDE